MILLLAPEKLISSTTKLEWMSSISRNVILFTSGENEIYRNMLTSWGSEVFHKIMFFKNYANNDFLEIEAMEACKKYNITKIIPMSEADILRAARIREKLHIPGQTVNNATMFRNKVEMKKKIINHGISVPDHAVFSDPLELNSFISTVGYPVVIKPISGRGSLDTFCLNNHQEFEAKLEEGLLSKTNDASLLVEKYIHGDMYHIDGIKIGHSIPVLSVSRYINNCLSFVNGTYLGSHTLSENNPLKKKIQKFSLEIINQTFEFPENSLIHMELFVDNNENFWFCEVACRIGGNGINDEVKAHYGIDIKLEYLKTECGLNSQINPTSSQNKIAARLLIPPVSRKLLKIPNACPDKDLLSYQSRGIPGKTYHKMQMSNDEIANFLMLLDNEHNVHTKLQSLANWFYSNTIWE